MKKRVYRPAPRPPQNPPDTSISLADLVKLANAGDPSARQLLSDTLDNNPAVWQKVGDLARRAEDALIRRIAHDDPFFIECYQRKVAELRAQLGGDESALEKMAVQRVVLSWLELCLVDAEFPGGSNAGLPHARLVQSAKSTAQRRYDAAVRSLMLIGAKLGFAAGQRRSPPLKVVPFGPQPDVKDRPAAASA